MTAGKDEIDSPVGGVEKFIKEQEEITRGADAIEAMLKRLLSETDGNVDRAMERLGGENATVRQLLELMKSARR